MRMYQWKEAEGHCRRALETDPENVEALNNLGLVLLKRGRPRAAVSYFSDASRLDPRSSEPRLNALRASLGLSAPSVGAVVFGVVLFFQAGTLGERIGGSVLVLAVTGAVVALHRRRRARHATDPLPAATLLRRLRAEAIRSFITPSTPVLWAVLVGALGFLAGSVSVVANPPPGTLVAGWVAWGAFVGAVAVMCGRALLRRRATARR
ncbi:MAG: tetratricopeptide repeat protein [Actinomycetota bacterium]|nr:tetratricopeptide repeat protein [Actinomycetota bacterium]